MKLQFEHILLIFFLLLVLYYFSRCNCVYGIDSIDGFSVGGENNPSGIISISQNLNLNNCCNTGPPEPACPACPVPAPCPSFGIPCPSGSFTVPQLESFKNYINSNQVKPLSEKHFYILINLFSCLVKLEDIDYSKWDIRYMTDLTDMFMGTGIIRESLKHNIVDFYHNFKHINSWDTSNVTSMKNMFTMADNALPDIDLSNWKVDNVTNMSTMFVYYKIFTGQGLEKWNVINVKYELVRRGEIEISGMKDMFSGTKFNNPDIKCWKFHPTIIRYITENYQDIPRVSKRLLAYLGIKSYDVNTTPLGEDETNLEVVLKCWDGYINQFDGLKDKYHTDEQLVAELSKLNCEGYCD